MSRQKLQRSVLSCKTKEEGCKKEIEEQRDREESNHSVRAQASGRRSKNKGKSQRHQSDIDFQPASQDQSRQYTTEE